MNSLCSPRALPEAARENISKAGCTSRRRSLHCNSEQRWTKKYCSARGVHNGAFLNFSRAGCRHDGKRLSPKTGDVLAHRTRLKRSGGGAVAVVGVLMSLRWWSHSPNGIVTQTQPWTGRIVATPGLCRGLWPANTKCASVSYGSHQLLSSWWVGAVKIIPVTSEDCTPPRPVLFLPFISLFHTNRLPSTPASYAARIAQTSGRSYPRLRLPRLPPSAGATAVCGVLRHAGDEFLCEISLCEAGQEGRN